MQRQTSAIDGYPNSTQPSLFLKQLSEEKLQLERKSCALQLARSATRTISDRRRRSEIKVEVYNHLIPILDQNFKAQQYLHKSYRKLVAVLSGALTLAITCAVVFY
ncbi:MAG: hypothetical protein ACC642_04965 [Pseudomonadales bacterium]